MEQIRENLQVKKTNSKLLLLIKFKNSSDSGDVSCINIGELNQLVEINNKDERKIGKGKIILDCSELKNKLDLFADFIESVDVYYDKNELELINFADENLTYKINEKEPTALIR